ncbi:MAG: 6-carboxytetrahydropterin synthase [Bacteroidales bacterium]|mgnify:FL=1|jgi:6-pyruvoyltetrahydropterin/6-carboxytetrahydropterin synthase|nr:6-carboxytetrahydropterin synthase [Bacteroidales bacterium]MDD3100756.1 6-carboxytetrahydropterin synthase [Bacteroidales bacterium]MDD3639792.1 6-carboxytetrahydropterin synthase [Bacteroidales bacterium]MDD3944376.1 6-carboxytetrahydropterin synthase [Bacteroidales bacterium]MDD4480824.1 6-carboxytetrahydropterin synthase [Bacteroidales bacterium]
MSQLHITREFRFEGAHALTDYDGKCRHIHGHSYRLMVTITGEPSAIPGDPKSGMIMDFNDLKKIVSRYVLDPLDHSLMLRKDAPLCTELAEQYDNIKVFDFQPTCEQLTLHIARILDPVITAPNRLHSVRLYETPTSFAEWVK